MKYGSFIFNKYAFDRDLKTLRLNYSFDDLLNFEESFTFDFDFVEYSQSALEQAIQTLFFMAGVSYFKAYPTPEIKVQSGALSVEDAAFLSKTYRKGLGEFFYVNKLDPNMEITFPAQETTAQAVQTFESSGMLVGIGGGKDSLVTTDILKDSPKISTWSVNHRSQLEPLIKRIGTNHLWVERVWDTQLLELNQADALNGHVPISAILAAVGAVVAVLSGNRDIVVSNENSANEPTLTYQNVPINHQYSKSSEFEIDYQSYLKRHFGDSIRYYSFLRPLSELQIAERFSREGFETYKDVFSSCNRAFTHDKTEIFWDGTCSKCAFVFLALTPFLPGDEIEALFSGKNLLLEPTLEETYKQLLGIAGDKPLECVGEIKECREAMRLAQTIYPQLVKYQFELPEDFMSQALAPHNMPPEIYALFEEAF